MSTSRIETQCRQHTSATAPPVTVDPTAINVCGQGIATSYQRESIESHCFAGPCDVNPCQNEGKCRLTTATSAFFCDCQPAFGGRHCEHCQSVSLKETRYHPTVFCNLSLFSVITNNFTTPPEHFGPAVEQLSSGQKDKLAILEVKP